MPHKVSIDMTRCCNCRYLHSSPLCGYPQLKLKTETPTIKCTVLFCAPHTGIPNHVYLYGSPSLRNPALTSDRCPIRKGSKIAHRAVYATYIWSTGAGPHRAGLALAGSGRAVDRGGGPSDLREAGAIITAPIMRVHSRTSPAQRIRYPGSSRAHMYARSARHCEPQAARLRYAP